MDFYPRSPCGERLSKIKPDDTVFQISIHALLAESDHFEVETLPKASLISIHALLAESDVSVVLIILGQFQFLSTLSLRRATKSKGDKKTGYAISIHALLAESDYSEPVKAFSTPHISIHALLAESDQAWL